MAKTLPLAEIRAVLSASEEHWKAERRSCQRYSSGWHRADAVLAELREIKKDVAFQAAKGRARRG